MVKYVKYNFLRGREFAGIDKLNEECLSWLERTGNGSMHHGIYRIPSEVFGEERAFLQPYYGTPNPPRQEMREYNVRKDNTISYHCCYYTVPSGTYRNAGTRVLVEELEGRLHIYSKETGKTLAIHHLSEVRGALIQDPSHRTIRGEGITEKEQKIHGYIGDTEVLDIFLAGIYQGKPRYYSKNLSYIISQMYAYKQVSSRKPLSDVSQARPIRPHVYGSLGKHTYQPRCVCTAGSLQEPPFPTECERHMPQPYINNII